MPRLFIANATKQRQELHYRLREVAGIRIQPIEIGGQIEVSGTLTDADVKYIIEQHERYGMVEVSRMDRANAYISMLYSIGQPIQMGAILEVEKLNTIFLIRKGKQIREHAAIAESRVLQQQLEEQDRQERLRQLEMSIVEEDANPASATEQIAEGVRIVPPSRDDEGATTKAQAPPSRRRSRRAN